MDNDKKDLTIQEFFILLGIILISLFFLFTTDNPKELISEVLPYFSYLIMVYLYYSPYGKGLYSGLQESIGVSKSRQFLIAFIFIFLILNGYILYTLINIFV